MKYRIIIQTKNYKNIEIVEFDSNHNSEVNTANRKLEKWDVMIEGSNNNWLNDIKNFVSYPMRERRDHTIIR
jgi:hypothetical protein